MEHRLLPAHIQAMLEPAFYPHPAPNIELLQTHASSVVLTGPFAYKLKKPVNLGFLDYSTLEKRKEFCLRELALNRSYAPSIYLDVLAVVTVNGGHALTNADAPGAVDYCVKMKQFSQSALLSEHARQGELPVDALDTFARRLAGRHAAAEARPEAGSPDALRKWINGNYEHSEIFVGKYLSETDFKALRAFTDGMLRERTNDLDSRRREGWVLAGHGDLHLGNLILSDNQVEAFDCIEFNDELRYIDGASEIAFLTMDIAAQGMPAAANRVLNAYLEARGDWGAAPLLPLYWVYRACVRAKVSALVAQSKQPSQEERARAAERSSRYFAWAVQTVRRFSAPEPQVAITHGLSGSGKSTVARRWAMEQGALHIRSDAVRKHLAGIPLDQRGPESIYSLDMTKKTFGRMYALAHTAVQAGFSVVLDGRYARRSERIAVMDFARERGLRFTILETTAPRDELERRLGARKGDVSDATAALLDSQMQNDEPLGADERPFTIIGS